MTEWYEAMSRSRRDEQPDEPSDTMLLLGYIVKHGESVKQLRAEVRERLERVEKKQAEHDAKLNELGELLRQILAKLEGE